MNRKFADGLRDERVEMFGEWYWADKFDLFKAGLITNTTDEEFEKFMVKESGPCEALHQGNHES
jgi:hypothetical protein